MAMIKCPECGKDISDMADKCPNCGYPIKRSDSEKKKTNISFIVIILIALFAVIGCVSVIFLSKRNDKIANDDAIVQSEVETEAKSEESTEDEYIASKIDGVWIRENDSSSYFSGMAIQVTNNNNHIKGEIIYTPSNMFPLGTVKWDNFKEEEDGTYSYKDSGVDFNSGAISKESGKMELLENNKLSLTFDDGSYQTWIQVSDKEKDDTIEKNKCKSGEKVLNEPKSIYSDSKVEILLNEVFASEYGCYVKFNVTNKTGSLLEFYSTNISIDGKGLGKTTGFIDLSSNSNDTLIISSPVSIDNGEIPKQIDGSLTVFDDSGKIISGLAYDAVFSNIILDDSETETPIEKTKEDTDEKDSVKKEKVELSTTANNDVQVESVAEKPVIAESTVAEPSYALSGDQMLCEEQGIKVEFKGIDDPVGNLLKDYIGVKFLITNNTGKDTIIMSSTFALNDCMMPLGFAANVNNGASAIATAKVKHDKLSEYGITSINKVSAKIHIKDVGDTGNYSINVQ